MSYHLTDVLGLMFEVEGPDSIEIQGVTLNLEDKDGARPQLSGELYVVTKYESDGTAPDLQGKIQVRINGVELRLVFSSAKHQFQAFNRKIRTVYHWKGAAHG